VVATWWERWPGRLETELAELRNAGIPFELEAEFLGQEQVIRIRVQVEVQGRQVDLVATYPDLYPFFRFEVQGPDLGLPHHQHPFGGNLCLIGRATENWHVGDTLAAFLTDRLPRTIAAGATTDPDEVGGIEEPQAEPFSDYYVYESGSLLIVDGSWSFGGERGPLLLGLERVQPAALMRGAVLEVKDEGGVVLASAAPRLADRYPDRLPGRWIRRESPIRGASGPEFLQALIERHPELETPAWQRRGDLLLDVLGVIFPEEVAWRQQGEGWVFLIRFRGRG
jgi:hypothetical protein